MVPQQAFLLLRTQQIATQVSQILEVGYWNRSGVLNVFRLRVVRNRK